MYQGTPTKVLTNEVRLSYVALSSPRKDLGGEEKYSATLLIPKSDTVTYNAMMAAIEAAAQVAMGGSWNGIRPPMMAMPIYDGDGVTANGNQFGAECKGHWVITATAKADKHRPQVVHMGNVKQELAPVDVYSGMYALVTVNFWGYNFNGKKGISCQLNNVCKTRDGEPLSGRANAEADFGSVGDTAAVHPLYAPQTPPANTPGHMQQSQYGQQQHYPQTQPYASQMPSAYVPGYVQQQTQYQPAPNQGYAPAPGAINPLTGLPA